MSFVTHCTSCDTLFKVVADQLKISDGWVRCGQCGNVFEAAANWVDTGASVSDSFNPAMPAPQLAQASQSKLPDKGLAYAPSGYSVDSRALQPSRQHDSGQTSHHAARLPGTWLDSDWVIETFDPSGQIPRKPVAAQHDSLRAMPTNVPTPTTTQKTLGFLEQAQRARLWRLPWVRLRWSLLSIVLLACLIVQIVFFEKNRLAAQWPQHKPWLDALCQQFGCQVTPLQHIDSIAVDSSSFNRISINNPQIEAAVQTYRLAVTLKNMGNLTVALPHLELSLQDTQDQIVFRKVLSPHDLGIDAATFAPSYDASGSVMLQISAQQLPANRIQGYRILAFYP